MFKCCSDGSPLTLFRAYLERERIAKMAKEKITASVAAIEDTLLRCIRQTPYPLLVDYEMDRGPSTQGDFGRQETCELRARMESIGELVHMWAVMDVARADFGDYTNCACMISLDYDPQEGRVWRFTLDRSDPQSVPVAY
jgi:hypothetical protein